MSPDANLGATFVLPPVEKWVRPAQKSVCGSVGIMQNFTACFSAWWLSFKIVFSSYYSSLFSFHPSLLIYFYFCLVVLCVRTSSNSFQNEVSFKQTHSNKSMCPWKFSDKHSPVSSIHCFHYPSPHPPIPTETLVNLLLPFQLSSFYQWSDLIAIIDFQVSSHQPWIGLRQHQKISTGGLCLGLLKLLERPWKNGSAVNAN